MSISLLISHYVFTCRLNCIKRNDCSSYFHLGLALPNCRTVTASCKSNPCSVWHTNRDVSCSHQMLWPWPQLLHTRCLPLGTGVQRLSRHGRQRRCWWIIKTGIANLTHQVALVWFCGYSIRVPQHCVTQRTLSQIITFTGEIDFPNVRRFRGHLVVKDVFFL